jgi:hypothetical protein
LYQQTAAASQTVFIWENLQRSFKVPFIEKAGIDCP